ncbi:MAG: class I adenylate-forming enzyme family protein [Firmicutes bacterium]|nr:class I adenylate-forming enzyme family protein [Bacillota bacterium]
MTTLSAKERRDALEAQYPVWPRHTMSAHFEEQAKRFADRPLLITEDAAHTYGEIWEKGKVYARALMGLGVRRREHVAVLMASEVEYTYLMLGIWLVGAVCVPINTMLLDEELLYLLRQSDSRWLFMHQVASGVVHSDTVSRVYDDIVAKDQAPVGIAQVVCLANTDAPLDPRFLAWDDFLQKAELVTEEERLARTAASDYPDEVADIIYTSGSTGLPKGVMITHDMFLRCGYSTALSRAFEEGRRVFTALPLYHVFALVEGILAVSFVGGALIIAPRFTPQLSLQIMEKHRANDFLCVPSMLVALLNHADLSAYDLSALYAMMCAAAPAPIVIWERAIQEMGLREICAGYGGTEATASTAHTEVGDAIETVATRVGRIKPGGVSGLPEFGGANIQYKTIDPFTQEDLDPGDIGELVVRGNHVTKGYYNKPDETAAVIDKDGWLRTGDLGRMHEGGYIELLGRSKELYKISGENVAPKEVEDVISRHPAVAQAYVIGVKDVMTSETGAAFIELRAGATCTRRELIDYCQERLARFKVPRYFWFMETDQWPMTGTGKIQKFRLQEIAEKRLLERGSGTSALEVATSN